jgi:hypothetical protein
MVNDKYYTVLKFANNSSEAGKVVIWATYGDHIWDSPIYEIVDYADTYKEAQVIARSARSN